MSFKNFRDKAIQIRISGKSYSEIQKSLKIKIPKSTLSYWFKKINITPEQEEKIRSRQIYLLEKSRIKAHAVLRDKRENYLLSIEKRVGNLKSILNNREIGKVVLAILYITEGSRKENGSITFGNSDPYIISLFLHLLRFCYSIDEQKLRCTVQCRADQNIKKLEIYWGKITKINRELFSKAQIDPRTIGKPTKKINYKGVCRINYFSADLSLELRAVAKVIHKGPIVQR